MRVAGALTVAAMAAGLVWLRRQEPRRAAGR
jgi:hypothetical protein